MLPFDISEMQYDFDLLLQAAETPTISIVYLTLETGGTTDPVYGTTTGSTKTYLSPPLKIKAVQKIISANDLNLLRSMPVKAGQSIFYFSKEVDLEGKEELVITDPGGVTWVPTAKPIEGIGERLGVTLGNSQMAQTLLCDRQA